MPRLLLAAVRHPVPARHDEHCCHGSPHCSGVRREDAALGQKGGLGHGRRAHRLRCAGDRNAPDPAHLPDRQRHGRFRRGRDANADGHVGTQRPRTVLSALTFSTLEHFQVGRAQLVRDQTGKLCSPGTARYRLRRSPQPGRKTVPRLAAVALRSQGSTRRRGWIRGSLCLHQHRPLEDMLEQDESSYDGDGYHRQSQA